jgi:hypothetical protein
MSGVMDHVNLTVKVDSQALSALDFSTVSDPLLRDFTQLLANGTGANQVSNHWHDQRTLTASSSENLDLAGSLVNGLGQTLTFTKIKALIVKAAVANVNDVVIGNAAANAWLGPFGAVTHTIAVKPGGLVVLVAPDANGYAVTAGTVDILKVLNGGAGTSVVYDIVIIGVD